MLRVYRARLAKAKGVRQFGFVRYNSRVKLAGHTVTHPERITTVRRVASILALVLGAMFVVGCSEEVPKTKKKTPEAKVLTPQRKAPEKPPESDAKVVTLASGLKYQDLTVGTGQEAKKGDNVDVDYTGWLKDGGKFDSSIDRGRPYTFRIGQSAVIKGWHEGIPGMKVGGKRKLMIPPDLAYGPDGFRDIPPNATLIFEIDLVSIDK
jgi:FKBP-type peptidyl-prolyl cis-trans isomerase FkpA